MLLKKLLPLILFVICIFSISPLALADIDIEGEAGVLMDFKTGEILWSKNLDQKRAPASTTKVMTALVALEKGNLDDMVKISSNVEKVDGTKIYLKPGEKVKLENLLYAMLLNSANDAALAIAEHVGGGNSQNFVKMMNERAKEIGAKNSHYANPHGLDQEGHYMTARDLALITRVAMKNSTFREMVHTKTKEWHGERHDANLINLNKLLWNYEGAAGVKTGYTTNARSCLSAAAKREDQEFISIVMGTTVNSQFTDSKKILDYGFENFKTVMVVDKGQQVSTIKVGKVEVPIIASEKVEVTLNKNEFIFPKWEVDIKNDLIPTEKDQKLGNLRVMNGAVELASVPICAEVSIAKNPTWLEWYFRITLTLFLLLIAKFFWKFKRKKSLFKTKSSRFRFGHISRKRFK